MSTVRVLVVMSLAVSLAACGVGPHAELVKAVAAIRK